MFSLQVVVIVTCLLFLVAVVLQIKSGRLLLRYSLLWICLAVLAILGSFFPSFVYALSNAFGFETPSNFILFFGMLFLMAVCLSLSMIVSKQARKIKSLVQMLAILDEEVGRGNE